MLNGDDGDVRIDLFFEHVLDCHQCPGKRARATAACTLVTDAERIVDEIDNLEPAAVAGQVRPYAFVEEPVDLSYLRVVAGGSGDGAANSGRGRFGVAITVRYCNALSGPDRYGKAGQKLIPF